MMLEHGGRLGDTDSPRYDSRPGVDHMAAPLECVLAMQGQIIFFTLHPACVTCRRKRSQAPHLCKDTAA